MKIDPGALELVSIDGEMVLILRLGRRATDPIPELEQIRRSYRMKEPERDTVGPFLAEATRRAAGARCKATPLRERYVAWCEARNERPLSLRDFRRAMTTRGFKSKHSNGTYWLDLVLSDPVQGPLL